MAWISFSQESGTGAATVATTASEYTGRVSRTTTILATTTAGSTDTVSVVQDAALEFISITSTSLTCSPLGETLTIEGTSNCQALKIATGTTVISGISYVLIVNDVLDESWNGNTDVTIDDDPGADAQFAFKLQILIPENQTDEVRTHKFSLSNGNADVSSDEVTITQEAGERTYALPVVESFTYVDIPASGGTASPTVIYSQTWGWNGQLTGGGTITEGATLTFSGEGVDTTTGEVSADSLATHVMSRRIVTAAYVTVTLNGKTSAASETHVYQNENVATYGDVIISGGEVEDIPASGGTASAVTGISAVQVISFTSGSTREGSVTLEYSEPITAASLTSVVTPRTKVGNLVATATGEQGMVASASYEVYQAANEVTNYGDIQHSLTTPVSVPVEGGIYDLPTLAAAHQEVSYTSGATSSYTGVEVTTAEQFTVSGFSLASGVVTVTENTTASARGGYQVYVSFSGQGSKEASITVVFNQSSAESSIVLSPDSLEYDSDGGEQSLTVTSNDSWTLEVVD